ncbi:unnamed protein product [Sphagnum troendelagicum]|uniref:Uncharacterized protein n=1 Tax=Sphagnum troendelagicum TaxID=128251 RepID=A0ABP0TMM8_9BRYO
MKSNTPATAPPNSTLIVHPGSGPKTTSPAGEDIQGPSPMDYSLELEVEFSTDMVIEMQGNAAKKARRTIIGRTLGGRATFKALHECLKLHLPAMFISVTLFTRGYFLILFRNEEGTISIKKFTSAEWNGLNLSFSRYMPNFDTSAQGAEALLTHMIKVQFSDLHEQFRNAKAFTIMASKFSEVFDIKAIDSYMKRRVGPMVTIEVRDIAKLMGYIRIPSMAEVFQPRTRYVRGSSTLELMPEMPKVRAPSPNVQHPKNQNSGKASPSQLLPKCKQKEAPKLTFAAPKRNQ